MRGANKGASAGWRLRSPGVTTLTWSSDKVSKTGFLKGGILLLGDTGARGIVDAVECLEVELSSSPVDVFGVDWASGMTCKSVKLIGTDGGI